MKDKKRLTKSQTVIVVIMLLSLFATLAMFIVMLVCINTPYFWTFFIAFISSFINTAMMVAVSNITSYYVYNDADSQKNKEEIEKLKEQVKELNSRLGIIDEPKNENEDDEELD